MKKLVLIAVLLAGCSKSPDHPNEVGAYSACQYFVKNSLKVPSSADFESFNQTPVKQLRLVHKANDRVTGYYLVAGYVTSMNSFGANIKTAYACRTHKTTGEDWIRDFVQID